MAQKITKKDCFGVRKNMVGELYCSAVTTSCEGCNFYKSWTTVLMADNKAGRVRDWQGHPFAEQIMERVR